MTPKSQKPKASQKKTDGRKNPPVPKSRILLKALLILFFALTVLLCFFSAVTGAFPVMQRQVRYLRPNAVGPLWIAWGLPAGILLGLCLNSLLNDLNLWPWRKKHPWVILLVSFAPGLLLILLGAYRDLGWSGIWLYLGIALLLFSMANLPGLWAKWTTEKALAAAQSGRWLLCRMEWVHFYPLKKLILAGLWLFCVLLTLRGIWLLLLGSFPFAPAEIPFFLLFPSLAILTFPRLARYLRNPAHCMPRLGALLPRKAIPALLEQERFEPVHFSEGLIQKSIPVYRSDSWFVIRGFLISRKLAASVRFGLPGKTDKLEILYLNGSSFTIDLGISLYRDGQPGLHSVLIPLFREITEMPEGWVWPPKSRRRPDAKERPAAFRQAFDSLLPDVTDEGEKLLRLLSMDMGRVKRELFAAAPRKARKQ